MDFLSIDVETANEDMSSICQIGIAEIKNGIIIASHSWLIDPEDDFSNINISIHGIEPKDVQNSPNYLAYAKTLNDTVQGKVLVCHTHFDRVAMNKVCNKYNVPLLDCIWLDSARISRRSWPEEFAKSGYGLANVCAFLGYDFKHHDAEEDAKAAAFVVLKASEHCGYHTVEQWIKRVTTSINSTTDLKINENGSLYGEVIVFTGSLSMTRGEAAQLAANAGCIVGSGVTKKTTLLVVGDQDITKLGGKAKSSKHLKGETLVLKGYPIKILTETDFQSIINT